MTSDPSQNGQLEQHFRKGGRREENADLGWAAITVFIDFRAWLHKPQSIPRDRRLPLPLGQERDLVTEGPQPAE